MSGLLSEAAWFFFQYKGDIRQMKLKLDEKKRVLFLLFWAVSNFSIVSDTKMWSLPHLLFQSEEFLKARKAKYGAKEKTPPYYLFHCRFSIFYVQHIKTPKLFELKQT